MTRSLTFHPTSHTRARGDRAETAAVRSLKKQGFRILERNHRNGAGEIDVIALEGPLGSPVESPVESPLESPLEDATLCFIEVKARAGATAGPALEAVHPRKQARIARAASIYLAQSGWEGPCRFDVLGMDRATGEGGETWTFTLIQDAFETAG